MNLHATAGSGSSGLVRRVVVIFMLAFGAMQAASAQQPPPEQQPTENSTEQGATEIDQTDLGGPYPEGLVLPEDQSPFLRDSRFSAQLRTFYFDRDKYDDSTSEAWTLGGSFTYQSGYLANFLRFGATAYTSQPLYAPDEKDGTSLLKPGRKATRCLASGMAKSSSPTRCSARSVPSSTTRRISTRTTCA